MDCPTCYIAFRDFNSLLESNHRCTREKLRDQFAMAALTAVLPFRDDLDAPRASYSIADKMLEIRDKKK